MVLKKTLTSLILTGALSIVSVGCTKNIDHSQYEYKGRIEGVELEFEEQTGPFYSSNILTAKKEVSHDNQEYTSLTGSHTTISRTITYGDDSNDDLKLDWIRVTTHTFYSHRNPDLSFDPSPTRANYDTTKTYFLNDPVGKPIVEQAQKQFDTYLKQIRQAKIIQAEREKKEGLELLK